MKITTELALSSKEVAQAFWNLNDEEQAEFFEHLYDITEQDGAVAHGDFQWCAMSIYINKNKKAKQQACQMTSWIFNHASDFLNKAF
jgi:hypothetical protein